MFNISNDFINNVSNGQQIDAIARSMNVDEQSSLDRTGQEIMNILNGSRVGDAPTASGMHLGQFVASYVHTDARNILNIGDEPVDVTGIDDNGYWEAWGDWYA